MIDLKLKGINKVRKRLASGEVKTYYFHRATDTALPSDPNSLEFLKAYAEAQEKIKSVGRNKGALKELIHRYMISEDFAGLKPRTKQDYKRQIIKIENAFGDMPIGVLNDSRVRGDFLDWRDGLAKASKKQADYAITVLGVILAWSMDRGLVAVNYAARPKKLYRSERASIIWSDNDIALFLKGASPELQLAMVLARDTGQRQGDLLRLTWAAYDGNYICLKQRKTGKEVEILVTRELRSLLNRVKVERAANGLEATTILTRPDGQPWKVDNFRHHWRKATLLAALDGKRFQDLRGTTVTALADAGCNTIQIAAVTGHSLKSVEAILEHYLARTRVQGDAAIHKFENARSTKLQTAAANRNRKGE